MYLSFEDFYKKTYSYSNTQLCKYVYNDQDREDVLQKFYTRILENGKWKEFITNEEHSSTSILHKSLYNEYLMLLRSKRGTGKEKRSYVPIDGLSEELSYSLDMEDSIQKKRNPALAEKILSATKTKASRYMREFYLKEKSVPQIAKENNTTAINVAFLLRIFKRNSRERFEEYKDKL